MIKLKNKVFYTVLSILTISLLSYITIFQVQKYIEQYNTINNSLNIATNGRNIQDKIPLDKDNMLIDENIKYMDYTVYTIILDENNNIKEVINHSNNSIDTNTISTIATTILNKENSSVRHIGNLFIEDYSYILMKNNLLVIIDNNKVNNILITSLEVSILIFILIESIIILISKKITNWIIIPVKETFTKQKDFIADASHELKTPLSVILASSEALEDNPHEKKWLSSIKNEAERMSILVNDLLELAKSENVLIKKEVGNLSKVVELSILNFEGLAYEEGIKLDFDIEDNIMFNMNENNIHELVEVLLDNAITHSYKNEKITISLKVVKNNIILSVQNKGREIPEEEIEKIFTRFYRSDKSRNRSNNHYGLGLSIAKNIVLNHNGYIEASSKDNITIFKVVFKKEKN